jgi:hypothetical protein
MSAVPQIPTQETADPEVAELAEGFVATTDSDSSCVTPPPKSQPQPRHHGRQSQLPANSGIPLWLDRAIAILLVALVVMLLKGLFS